LRLINASRRFPQSQVAFVRVAPWPKNFVTRAAFQSTETQQSRPHAVKVGDEIIIRRHEKLTTLRVLAIPTARRPPAKKKRKRQ